MFLLVYFAYFDLYWQNVINLLRKEDFWHNRCILKHFNFMMKKIFHWLLMLNKHKFLISAVLTFRKIRNTSRDPPFYKVRTVDSSFQPSKLPWTKDPDLLFILLLVGLKYACRSNFNLLGCSGAFQIWHHQFWEWSEPPPPPPPSSSSFNFSIIHNYFKRIFTLNQN